MTSPNGYPGLPCTGRSARTLSSWPEYRKSGEVAPMTAFPMPAEDNDGTPSPLGSLDSSSALLRLPKYYQVKKHLLDFTAAISPGTPVPPQPAPARPYGTATTTGRPAPPQPG